MPLTSLPYWFAKCDNCGEDADYDEYSAFKDPGVAADQALDGEWTRDGDVWHCPACPPLGDESDDA
jgi:hypothetical protein